MDTDYENYAVGYACGSFGSLANGQMAYILGRQREMSSEYMVTAINVLAAQELETSRLVRGNQTHCIEEEDLWKQNRDN